MFINLYRSSNTFNDLEKLSATVRVDNRIRSLPEFQEHVWPGKSMMFFALVADGRQQWAIGRRPLVNVYVMCTAMTEITRKTYRRN